MTGLSSRLSYKGWDLSLSILPGLSLPGLSLTSLFRPQSDDDVKRGTIVIRLWRSYAREALLGAACFRRRKNFFQRLIDQGRLIHQRFFPLCTKIHDPLILDTRIR